VPPPGWQPGQPPPTPGASDVTVGTIADPSAIDSNPDARQRPPAAEGQAGAAPAAGAPAATEEQQAAPPQRLPGNHPVPPKTKAQKPKKEPKKKSEKTPTK